MYLLLIILFLILAVILIVFTAMRRIISFFLGAVLGRKTAGQSYYGGNKSQQSENRDRNSQNSNEETAKIFSRDEGDYVSFEEVE